MKVASTNERYLADGYVALPQFVPEQITRGFLVRLKSDLARSGTALGALRQSSPLLRREAIELYGYHYAPMATFLWGMTPAISALVGRDLLPTYAYFRIYGQGDICRVHSDRPSCEHSLSLMLATSDDLPWPLDVGAEHIETPRAMADDDFGTQPYSSIAMNAGDAVLYQGVHRIHGRVTPNPNRWTAHLFLHWIDPDGPYADKAFDGQAIPDSVDIELN